MYGICIVWCIYGPGQLHNPTPHSNVSVALFNDDDRIRLLNHIIPDQQEIPPAFTHTHTHTHTHQKSAQPPLSLFSAYAFPCRKSLQPLLQPITSLAAHFLKTSLHRKTHPFPSISTIHRHTHPALIPGCQLRPDLHAERLQPSPDKTNTHLPSPLLPGCSAASGSHAGRPQPSPGKTNTYPAPCYLAVQLHPALLVAVQGQALQHTRGKALLWLLTPGIAI
jgi:hypothetical protein